MPSAEPAPACSQFLVFEGLIETGPCEIETCCLRGAVDMDKHIQRTQKMTGFPKSLIQNYNTISYIMIKTFKNNVCNFWKFLIIVTGNTDT